MIKKIIEGMELAESPFWDDKTYIYYFVDILKKRMYWYKDGISYKQYDKYLSFLFKNNKDEICAAFEDGVYILDDKYDRTKKYVTFEYDGFRCNDGGISPDGKLFIGRMNNLYNYGEKDVEDDGKLFLIENGNIKEVLKNVGISNGIAWNLKGNKVYFIDSFTKSIQEFDYINCQFINPKVVYKFEEGAPDGMSIDINDKLWIAHYGGGKLICIETINFSIVYEISFNEKNVTSCCFCGANLDEMLVTTAEDEYNKGSVYLLKLDIIKGKNKNIYIE